MKRLDLEMTTDLPGTAGSGDSRPNSSPDIMGRRTTVGLTLSKVWLTCPENPEPVVMRVFGVQGTQEALDEAEEARSGRDHQEVA